MDFNVRTNGGKQSGYFCVCEKKQNQELSAMSPASLVLFGVADPWVVHTFNTDQMLSLRHQYLSLPLQHIWQRQPMDPLICLCFVLSKSHFMPVVTIILPVGIKMRCLNILLTRS